MVFIIPGYFPPRVFLMKKTVSMMRTKSAMAHIKPMNHPCVTMSTCSRVYSAHTYTKRHCMSFYIIQVFLFVSRYSMFHKPSH